VTKVNNPELTSPELRALVESNALIGKCACAILEPAGHNPVLAAGWKPEWEEFSAIFPHVPERFFLALSQLNWGDIAKRPVLKFESAGHITHAIAPVIIANTLRCFLYLGYIQTAKPQFKDFATLAEERNYNLDRFLLAVKELPIIPEATLVRSITSLVTQCRALLSKDLQHAGRAVAEEVAFIPPVADQTPVVASPSAQDRSIHANVIRSLTRDIRTALNGNIGVTGLLVRLHNKEIMDLLETMHKGNDTLLTLLDNLHDYHDILCKNISVSSTVIEVKHSLERIFNSFKKRLSENNLELQIRLGPEVPGYIITDIERLQQVIRNAVYTVMRYSISGKVLIAVKKGISTENNVELQILVQNVTGKSADTSTANGIGESEGSDFPIYDNLDIGMLVSEELVAILGGSMKVKTDEQPYVLFSLKAEAIPLEGLTFDTSISKELSRQSVVIVHPSSVGRNALSLQSSYWGMKVQTFGTLEAAQAWLDRNEPASIIVISNELQTKNTLISRLDSSRMFSSIPLIIFKEHEAEEVVATSSRQLHAATWSSLRSILEECIALKREEDSAKQSATSDTLAESYPNNILLVEDDVMNRKLLERILSKLGYTPTLCTNGIEAVKMTTQSKYDLILMDLQMPGMDGMTAAKTILNNKENGDAPRIIALTANASASDRDNAFKAGMIDFITKPINIPTLQSTIIRWTQQVDVNQATESAPSTSSPGGLIDENVIIQTRELDQFSEESILDRLIHAFVKEAPPIIYDMQNAFASNNAFMMTKATSALMGMCRNLGLTQLSALTVRISSGFGNIDTDEMTKLLKEVSESFKYTSDELQNFLSASV
jgi:CheY-like chemotaxis protein/signal transduction histidine kinase